MSRVSPPSTSSSVTRSALSRPVWGSAGGELSTLIERAGRLLTAETSSPVSGAVGGGGGAAVVGGGSVVLGMALCAVVRAQLARSNKATAKVAVATMIGRCLVRMSWVNGLSRCYLGTPNWCEPLVPGVSAGAATWVAPVPFDSYSTSRTADLSRIGREHRGRCEVRWLTGTGEDVPLPVPADRALGGPAGGYRPPCDWPGLVTQANASAKSRISLAPTTWSA